MHEAEQFWKEFVQLVVDTYQIREHRDSLNKWVTGEAALRAIASCASIAGWLRFPHLEWVWAAVLAAAQIADSLKDVFPFSKRQRSLTKWLHALLRLRVDTQRTWAEIESGRYTSSQIRNLCHRMNERRFKIDKTHTPEGFIGREDLLLKAELQADKWFRMRYNIEESGREED